MARSGDGFVSNLLKAVAEEGVAAVVVFVRVLVVVLVFIGGRREHGTSLSPELAQGIPKFLSRKLGGRRFIPISGQQSGVVLIRKALVEKHYDPAIRLGAYNAPS